MIQGIVKFLLNGAAILIAAYLIPNVVVESYLVSLVVAVILALLNILVKPILIILSLPINILTLGLFTLVIDTLIVLLAVEVVPGFEIDSFWTGFLFAIVLSLVSFVLHKIII